MSLLEVAGLGVAFGGLAALKNVSFSLDDREIVGLIGPNGAGKTTLFNCLSGFQAADQGTMRFRGEPMERRAPYEIAARGLLARARPAEEPAA